MQDKIKKTLKSLCLLHDKKVGGLLMIGNAWPFNCNDDVLLLVFILDNKTKHAVTY